jgi:hypothetical protein
VLKGPAADATDAPQPWGLLCNPMMKMKMIIICCPFPSNGAQVEWNWQGRTEVLGEKPVPVPLCPPQIPHRLTLGSKSGLRGGRPAANRLSHGTASTEHVETPAVSISVYKRVSNNLYLSHESERTFYVHSDTHWTGTRLTALPGRRQKPKVISLAVEISVWSNFIQSSMSLQDTLN